MTAPRTITLKLSQCRFDKDTGVLTFEGAPGYPSKVSIFSEKTGKTVDFYVDMERAMEMEFWDGELMEYRPSVECAVKKLVLR